MPYGLSGSTVVTDPVTGLGTSLRGLGICDDSGNCTEPVPTPSLNAMDPVVVIGPDGNPRVVTAGPINTVTVSPSGDVYRDSSGRVIGTGRPASPSLTSWLNENSGLALGIGGGFLLLAVLAKAGR